MSFVFDTSSLSNVLNHYYPDRFPTFWEKFHEMIRARHVFSVREVKFELGDKFDQKLIERFKLFNASFFENPTIHEMAFITEIYSIPHFRQNLSRKKLLKGGYFADPFIVSKAKIENSMVVTEENKPENGARIPNICQHFSIECLNLEKFLALMNWSF